MISSRISLATGVLILSGIVAAAQARETIGTLTCTTEDAPTAPSAATRLMSCSFEPSSKAAKLSFAGNILGGQLPPGRQVVVWTVLADGKAASAETLEGRYASTPEDKVEGVGGLLVGGSTGKIALQPLTQSPRVEDQAVKTIVTLELKPVKA